MQVMIEPTHSYTEKAAMATQRQLDQQTDMINALTAELEQYQGGGTASKDDDEVAALRSELEFVQGKLSGYLG